MPQHASSVIANKGKAGYVDGSFWRNIGVGERQLASDDEDDDDADQDGEEQMVAELSAANTSDPLTDMLLGDQQAPLDRHRPIPKNAMLMWKTYAERVEPIIRILHIPSTRPAMEQLSQNPQFATPHDDCLAFSIYHFAVFSMTETECLEKLGQPRGKLLSTYHLATRQALVAASFLKTTNLVVLQALILFLLASRYTYDAQTYWILTGVAFRPGQRIGVHRDGTKLGLSPFDTEMRRRIFTLSCLSMA